jgi:hypothetical protein
MKMVDPPRRTPVSTKSPGVPSLMTASAQSWMLSRRLRPTIVCACEGQSMPFSRR